MPSYWVKEKHGKEEIMSFAEIIFNDINEHEYVCVIILLIHKIEINVHELKTIYIFQYRKNFIISLK